MRPRVLVVDDKPNMLALFVKALSDAADVETATDGVQALGLLAAGAFDVVVTDIRMPGVDGLTVLREAKAAAPDIEVILMTGYGSIEKAVEAIKAGAYDFLTKPFDPDEAVLIIGRAVERKRLREEARDLRRALDGVVAVGRLVGKSAPMRQVFALIERAAAADATVLIEGESGTGKELAARAIHAGGPRAGEKFVPINCGAIPESLVESELFGHVRGAFTGAVGERRGLVEEADGGTLFLDEIGELPLAAQVKLTRVLQERAVRRVGATTERKVDVRVIGATNVDLRAAVAGGRFRDDLYYRLNVFPIALPPLRNRKDDIPLLVATFLDRHRERRSALGLTHVDGFTLEAIDALCRYDWPGNVRELENAVERALAISDGPHIELEALPEDVCARVRPRLSAANATALPYRDVMRLTQDRASREYLIALMREFDGNVTRAAERAAMERESLHRLLRRYAIRSNEFKG